MSMDTTERWAKNRETAELLGWTNLRICKTFVIHPAFTPEMDYLNGIDPQGEENAVPDFFGSLDAVADALPQDASIHIDGTDVDIYDVDRENPDDPWGHWRGHGDTRQAAAGNALLAFARAQKEQSP